MGAAAETVLVSGEQQSGVALLGSSIVALAATKNGGNFLCGVGGGRRVTGGTPRGPRCEHAGLTGRGYRGVKSQGFWDGYIFFFFLTIKIIKFTFCH